MTKSKSSVPRKRKISIDEIRNRAHKIYEDRMLNHKKGNAYQDWLKAEKELVSGI